MKLLLGIWTADEGNIVKYRSPNLSSKIANQLLENVLFTTNIYGKNTVNRMDVAFTIPIMYLPAPYSHGRIYFKFRLMDMIHLQPVEDPLKFDFTVEHNLQTVPISIFCSLPDLNEAKNTTKIDALIWTFLHSGLTKLEFDFLHHDLVTNHLNIKSINLLDFFKI